MFTVSFVKTACLFSKAQLYFKKPQQVHFSVKILFQLEEPSFKKSIFQKTRKCTNVLMGINGHFELNCIASNEEFLILN